MKCVAGKWLANKYVLGKRCPNLALPGLMYCQSHRSAALLRVATVQDNRSHSLEGLQRGWLPERERGGERWPN